MVTTRRIPQLPSIAGRALRALSLGLALSIPIVSSAATTPIYKCFDKNLGLLYTDEPCKDGEVLTIRAGDADPAAVARLERARDALDLAAAQRLADQRRAATEMDLAARYASEGPASAYGDMAAGMSYGPYDYGLPWLYPGFSRHHPPHSRPPRPMQPRHFAFKPTPMTHWR